MRDLYSHHNGGTVRFGPDGALYVSAGDDGTDCLAQDLDQPNGKVLRLDVLQLPGPGPPPLADITPPDNPFPGSTPRGRLVYAYGLRNPFRDGRSPDGVAVAPGVYVFLVETPAGGRARGKITLGR